MKKKYVAVLLCVVCSLSLLWGCGNKGSNGAADTGGGAADVADEESDGPDYASMTMEELYDLAKQETGTITVYSTTSSADIAVKKFKKAYPDLPIEYIESDTSTVANRIETESETGNVNADVLEVKDNSGEIYNQLVLYDYLDIYQPKEIIKHIDPELLKYGMPVSATYSPWYYNTLMYPDGCPIESWWDIVQGYDQETGKFTDQFWTIYTKDITSASYAALWAQLIVDGDAMTEQYEKQYGEPLKFTYMDHLNNQPGVMEFPENNGGVELLWRFTQMKQTELDDGDQVVSAVDESLNGPTLGLCSGSKLDNINNGMNIMWVTGLEPYTAFLACDYIYVVNQCDNPAGARLFVNFALGGDDGASGCQDAYNGIGKWSIRDDVVFDKTPYTAEEVNLKAPDFDEIYGYYPNVKAYWIYWRDQAPK
ncbi:MAG: extracellular solute-binding protein [Lachnospiraceae bacterium]|jgi:iron(III) transport system substrate-binding protein|nr:extracellular solute-binding protein [Lachnospiraceae bacterium]